jgi:transposase-like protein
MKAQNQLRQLMKQAVVEEGSVNRLATQAGVPQSSLSAWLRGQQDGLSWSVVARLMDYCDLRIQRRK